MGGLGQAIARFWEHPFKEDGTVVDWFLFLGLLIVLAFAWSRILKFIVEA